MKRYIFLLVFLAGGVVALYSINLSKNKTLYNKKNEFISEVKQTVKSKTPASKPESKSQNETTVTLNTPPEQKILQNDYHIFQSFNNCGPAALSMTLSYYGIVQNQKTLGQQLRPYQNPQGDNDDKSVTLSELAEKSKEFGFIPYHRPNGNIELIKLLITYDIPVITRTWLKENEDVGHYRIIKGYNNITKELIQDDSLQGKNLQYSYDSFNALWKKFNYEYLILVPKEKESIAVAILGNEADYKQSWTKALQNAKEQLQIDPSDTYAGFNLSVALYNIGDFGGSVEEFEKVQNKLSTRTLWYQIEPILAYYELEDYDKVFEITDSILNNNNRAFSELYIIRGDIYKKQGKTDLAKAEYEKAVFYNSSLKSAQQALMSL